MYSKQSFQRIQLFLYLFIAAISFVCTNQCEGALHVNEKYWASAVVSEWGNVKENLEKGCPMLTTDSQGNIETAVWIEDFREALDLIALRKDYGEWLDQFFQGEYPLESASVEMIREMSFDDISCWITYLMRCDRWQLAGGKQSGYYSVVVDEIENGRMEAVVERLKFLSIETD